MSDGDKKKPGREPEIFKVPLPFEEAVDAALKTKLPADRETQRKKVRKRRKKPQRG